MSEEARSDDLSRRLRSLLDELAGTDEGSPTETAAPEVLAPSPRPAVRFGPTPAGPARHARERLQRQRVARPGSSRAHV